jgi:hypothetical protein
MARYRAEGQIKVSLGALAVGAEFLTCKGQKLKGLDRSGVFETDENYVPEIHPHCMIIVTQSVYICNYLSAKQRPRYLIFDH